MSIRELLPNSVIKTLDAIGIVEETLEKLKKEQKSIKKRKLIDSSFALCMPSESFKDNPKLIRSHATEIALRIVSGEDTRLATYTELLPQFLKASLDAPLTFVACLAYQICFERAGFELESLPEYKEDSFEYQEALDLINDLKRKCYQKDRILR